MYRTEMVATSPSIDPQQWIAAFIDGITTIQVFHTRDQNHVTAGGANPFWGSNLATAAVGAVYMLSKLAANPVKGKP